MSELVCRFGVILFGLIDRSSHGRGSVLCLIKGRYLVLQALGFKGVVVGMLVTFSRRVLALVGLKPDSSSPRPLHLVFVSDWRLETCRYVQDLDCWQPLIGLLTRVESSDPRWKVLARQKWRKDGSQYQVRGI